MQADNTTAKKTSWASAKYPKEIADRVPEADNNSVLLPKANRETVSSAASNLRALTNPK